MAMLYFALRVFGIKHNLTQKTTAESLRDGRWHSGPVRTDTSMEATAQTFYGQKQESNWYAKSVNSCIKSIRQAWQKETEVKISAKTLKRLKAFSAWFLLLNCSCRFDIYCLISTTWCSYYSKGSVTRENSCKKYPNDHVQHQKHYFNTCSRNILILTDLQKYLEVLKRCIFAH